MKNSTKAIASLIGALTLVLQIPVVQGAIGSFLAAHSNVSAIFAGLLSILALIHVPSQPQQ